MRYYVLNSISVGSNTAVIISGNGEGLKSGIILEGDNRKAYKLLSIGMAAGIDPSKIGLTTDLLIEGSCNAKVLIVR